MSIEKDPYLVAGQLRLLALVEAMAGEEVAGVAPSVLAKRQGCSAALMTRDLANLHKQGWAERLEGSGCWRLTPRFAQLSSRVLTGLAQAQAQLTDLTNRYSRS